MKVSVHEAGAEKAAVIGPRLDLAIKAGSVIQRGSDEAERDIFVNTRQASTVPMWRGEKVTNCNQCLCGKWETVYF